MPKPSRPFIREYRKRSSRPLIPKEMTESVSAVTDIELVDSDTSKPAQQRTKSGAGFDAAPAIFHVSEQHVATGRVLPSLLHQINHTNSKTEKERRPRKREMEINASSATTPEKNQETASEISTLPVEGAMIYLKPIRRGLNMSDEFVNLSVSEMLSMIERAQAEIDRRKAASKESLKAEIAEKLKSAGLNLGDLFPDVGRKARKSGKSKADGEKVVATKYKNHVTGETWSGRGAHPPQWVKSIMLERRWTLEEFKQSDEFLAQN